MAQFLTTIECAIQTKPVAELELALIERKQARYERVHAGGHCAKVMQSKK